jgi:hypothetical protein
MFTQFFVQNAKAASVSMLKDQELAQRRFGLINHYGRVGRDRQYPEMVRRR